MPLLVQTLSMVVILAIAIPSSDGRNVVTQESEQMLGFKRASLISESQLQVEVKECQEVIEGGLTQTKTKRSQKDKSEKQLPTNALVKPKIKSRHQIQIKALAEPKLSDERVKKKVVKHEDHLPTYAKEDERNKLSVEPMPNVKTSQEIRLVNPVGIKMRDIQRTNHKHAVSSLWKREQRQTSKTEKSKKNYPGSSESRPHSSSKLKETLHTLSCTLSKAKQTITRSMSSLKSPTMGSMRGSKSPKPDMSHPYTSGYAKKPSGFQLSTAQGIPNCSSEFPWLRNEYQTVIPEEEPPSPPHKSRENTQQIWDFINRNKSRISFSETNTDVRPSAETATNQVPDLRLPRDGNRNDPTQGLRPPSPPKSQSPGKSREAGQSDSGSEEDRRTEGFISRSKSRLGISVGSVAAGQGLQQSPPKPPSPKNPQSQQNPPSSSSSSSSSPETTTGDPRPQLRKKLSKENINDKYNTIANKIKSLQ